MPQVSPSSGTEPAGLRSNALGLPAVLVQSVAAMAPVSACAFSLGAAVPFAGRALPLAALLALLICCLIALNMGSLATYLPSAGSCLTYVSRGLGPHVGWLTGWLLSLTLMIPLQLLVLGPVTDTFLQRYFHVSLGWAAWTVIFAVIILSVAYVGVKVSLWVGVVFGLLGITVFVALSAWLIICAGPVNATTPFDPASSAEPGLGGWQGILHGMLFAFLAFAGFEASAPLAEETCSPRRTVPRALLLSTVSVGFFYIICTYAGILGWGMDRLSTYASDANPWATLAKRAWGVLDCLVIVAILMSALVNAVAILNAAGRVLYALGRTRTLPAQLAHVNPRFRTPDWAMVGAMTVGLLATVWLGSLYGPLTAFALLGGIITILLLIVYMATCLAVPCFYWREHRHAFSIVRHLLVPLVTVIVLGVTLYAQFVPAPPWPLNLAGLFCVVWVVLGLLLVLWFGLHAPQALWRCNKVYLEEDGSESSS